MREPASQFKAEAAVDLRRNYGIAEVVRVSVPFVAEIEPRLRILVHKQGCERPYIPETIIFERAALPRMPSFNRERIHSCTDAKQVHHHQFAVVIPPVLQKA